MHKKRETTVSETNLDRKEVTAYNTSINQGVFKVSVACEELLLQKRGVLDISEERSVDGMACGKVLEINTLDSHAYIDRLWLPHKGLCSPLRFSWCILPLGSLIYRADALEEAKVVEMVGSLRLVTNSKFR